MKKTMIAMAVAAALPVAAQADVTISGSISTSFENSSSAAKTLDIDSAINLASTEVLANGMTATANLAMLTNAAEDGENRGKATLSGDFGTLTVSNSIDRDGVYMFGNVGAGNQTSLYETTDSATTSNAVHYSGEMAGLSIQAQVNASTDATEAAHATNGPATQIAARYNFNGLTFGYGTTNADMTVDRASTYVAASGSTPASGFSKKTIAKGSTAGVAYSFGDLTVSYGKESNTTDAVVTAKYATTVGAVAVNAMFVDTGATGDYTIAGAKYSMDALTLAVDYSTLKGNSSSKLIDTGVKTSRVSATYAAGDMTTTVGSQWDGAVDFSVALDLGNADLSAKREGSNSANSAAKTSLTYKVSF